MYTAMVTGGLGSGKSTLVGLLCELGAVSIDLDEISHTLLQDDDAYIAELAERFGEGILDECGAVVPARLAARAFATPQATADLNAIAFPHIMQRANDYLLDVHCTPRTSARVLAVEVPLLTEVPQFAELADEVIAVSASPELRLRRAIERGMQPADALARLQRQPTDAQRAAIATTICPNDGSPEQLRSWAQEWWAATRAKLGQAG